VSSAIFSYIFQEPASVKWENVPIMARRCIYPLSNESMSEQNEQVLDFLWQVPILRHVKVSVEYMGT